MMADSVPTYALYGHAVDNYRLSPVAGAQLAAASGDYIGRGNKCEGKDDTCGANKVKGENLCFGHLRQANNLADVAAMLESEG